MFFRGMMMMVIKKDMIKIIFDFIKHQSDHCLALYVSPSSCWICWIHATSSWVSKSSKAVSFDPIRTCHTCYTNFSPFTKQDQNEVWPRFSLIALKEFNEVLKDSMPWVRCAFGNVFPFTRMIKKWLKLIKLFLPVTRMLKVEEEAHEQFHWSRWKKENEDENVKW